MAVVQKGQANANANAARANESARRAKQMPESVQYAIVQVLPNIVNGAFWGFTDFEGVSKHIEAIQNSGGNLVARRLGNACLIEANPNYLVKAVAMIDPNAMTQADINNMTSKMAEADIAFEKFLIAKAKTKEGQPKFGGSIGIYCVNDVTTINSKGVTYPAFRVNMQKALGLLGRYGYQVQVGGTFVDAMQAAQSGQALWSSVTLSPTKTGLFINVRSTVNNDQAKALEQQFKQAHGIK